MDMGMGVGVGVGVRWRGREGEEKDDRDGQMYNSEWPLEGGLEEEEEEEEEEKLLPVFAGYGKHACLCLCLPAV